MAVEFAPEAEAGAPMPLGHGRAWQSFEKIGVPVNRLFNRVGSEGFWPTSLEQESEKAARILKAFCKEGVYTSLSQEQRDSSSDLKHESNDFELDKKSKSKSKSKCKSKKNKQEFNSEKLPEYPADAASAIPEQLPPRPTTNAPKPPRVLLKIPPSIIQNALGLAIFTVARAGTWGASLACGSGVLIARKHDNTWSSPSGIIVNTVGVGFLTGIDVYDCVVVINTQDALEKFKTTRVSLGGEVSVTAGPWGAGRQAEFALGKGPLKPVYTYIKSRGLYVGMQLDGTVIGVRGDENARFYGERIDVDGILRGIVGRWTGLEEVVGEIERGAVDRTVGRNFKQAPVLLEFIDRRGQIKGKDGVWVNRDEERHDERAVHYQDDKSVRFGVVEEQEHPSDRATERVVDDGEWEDEKRFHDLDTKKADDGEWEDERGFHNLDQQKPSSETQDDDGEWEDASKFYDMEEKNGAWEKTDRYA